MMVRKLSDWIANKTVGDLPPGEPKDEELHRQLKVE